MMPWNVLCCKIKKELKNWNFILKKHKILFHKNRTFIKLSNHNNNFVSNHIITKKLFNAVKNISFDGFISEC